MKNVKAGNGLPPAFDESENLDRAIEYICRLCLFSNPKPSPADVSQTLNSCSILSENAVLGITQGLKSLSSSGENDEGQNLTGSHVCELKCIPLHLNLFNLCRWDKYVI